jgi:hypothetical protein
MYSRELGFLLEILFVRLLRASHQPGGENYVTSTIVLGQEACHKHGGRIQILQQQRPLHQNVSVGRNSANQSSNMT